MKIEVEDSYLKALELQIVGKKEEAIKMYNTAADADCVEAMLQLGKIYGTNKEAYEWYLKAAEQGNSDGQFQIGLFFYKGWGGVKYNYETASKWYEKSSLRGHGEASYKLADLYYDKYIGKDMKDADRFTEALKWYIKAYQFGSEEIIKKSREDLIRHYERGQGVEKNLDIVNSLKEDKKQNRITAWETVLKSGGIREDETNFRVMISATMSAGKSTLINAIVGQSLVATSQAACTGGISFLSCKDLPPTQMDIEGSVSYDGSKMILSDNGRLTCNFESFYPKSYNITLIDTPGVNSAVHSDHGEITRKALKDEKYDLLLYVINGEKLGTEDEISHLTYISKNVTKKKVIFLVNKLDAFHAEDSIEASLIQVKEDLVQLGWKKPEIYPISAYFSLLLKMKRSGGKLSDDDDDALEMYCKKFSREQYDLSQYHAEKEIDIDIDDELLGHSVKCGFYQLEKRIYGGK